MVNFESIFTELYYGSQCVYEFDKDSIKIESVGVNQAKVIIRDKLTIGFTSPSHTGKTNWLGEKLRERADYMVLCSQKRKRRFLDENPSVKDQVYTEILANFTNFNCIFIDEARTEDGIRLYKELVNRLAHLRKHKPTIRIILTG